MAFTKVLVAPSFVPLQRVVFPAEVIGTEIDTSASWNGFMTVCGFCQPNLANMYYPPTLTVQGQSKAGQWADIVSVPITIASSTIGIAAPVPAGTTSIATAINEGVGMTAYIAANATPAAGEFFRVVKSDGANWTLEDGLTNNYVNPITVNYWALCRYINVPLTNVFRIRPVIKARAPIIGASAYATDMTDNTGSLTIQADLILNNNLT